MAGVWQGIERGFAAHEKRMADKEDREYKERQEERIEKEFNETRMLRRLKSVSEYLGDRSSPMTINRVGLNKVKRLIGDIEGANEYLAKLEASPTALKTVLDAIETRGNNIGTLPTGQELMDNIVVVAENYGNESWMKAYEEGVSIGQVLLTDPDSLLDDEVLASLTSRIGALPTVTRPQVGVEIAPAYLSKIDDDEQVKTFDNALLRYAGSILETGEMSETERSKLRTDINNYNTNPSALRKRFGQIVLHEIRQLGTPLFIPGVATDLNPLIVEPTEINRLKELANTDRREQAIQKFNEMYGPGQAELFLGLPSLGL